MSAESDQFLDTPALRAERIGPNPRWHWCYSCGWRWESGTNGNHRCEANLVSQRDDALAEVARLKAELDGAHQSVAASMRIASECDERCAKLEAALRPLAFFTGDFREDEDRYRIHDMFAAAREALASLPTPDLTPGQAAQIAYGESSLVTPPDHTAEIATIRETAQREGWV